MIMKAAQVFAQPVFAHPLRALAVLCSALMLFTSPMASADEVMPDAQVKKITEEVLEILRSDKDIKAGNTRKAAELIEVKVLPNFDFNKMTKLAVGREWKNATPEQQKALTGEFHTLLVRTYANALTSYKNQVIDFLPFKMVAGDTDVTVRTQVKQPGAKPVSIDYSLLKENDAWKVYDVTVAGVSLVTSYRDQFRQEISTGGIDGLIKSLQAKNQAPVAAVKK
jgi:phospholipid transport system substrate-binding protein